MTSQESHESLQLDIRRLALGLRQISSAMMDVRDPLVTKLWFRGAERYFDLFVDLDVQGRPVWLQLTFRGHALTADFEKGRLTTERTSEFLDKQGPSVTKMLFPQRQRDAAMLELVFKLLGERSEPALVSARLALVDLAARSPRA